MRQSQHDQDSEMKPIHGGLPAAWGRLQAGAGRAWRASRAGVAAAWRKAKVWVPAAWEQVRAGAVAAGRAIGHGSMAAWQAATLLVKLPRGRRRVLLAWIWRQARAGIRRRAAGARARVRQAGSAGWGRIQAAWGRAGSLWGRARGAVDRHPVSPLLYVTVLAVGIGAIAFNGVYSRAYVLNVDGEEVGVIADQAELDAIVSRVESRVASILGEDYDYDAEITLTPAYATASEVSDAEEVTRTLFDSVGALVNAYALSVDGYELGYALSQAELEEMLDEIAQPYLTEQTVRHSFAEEIEIYPRQVPANTEFDVEVLKTTLTGYEVEEARYVVESGDTFNAIAYSLDMTPAALKELNPDVEPNTLRVGQELVIQQAVPYLSVITVNSETYEQAVESPVEYVDTAELYVGETSVQTQGTDGMERVEAEVTYRNGVEQERTVKTTTTLQEATTTYVYRGTTPKPVTASRGYLIWPLSGSITSYYGGRYLYGGYDFHLGIDIAAPYGTTIKAADGGTVTYSGWQGSYGKLVVITHDNGMKTYYAHNSTLLVSVGDKVYQGQPIARVGLTGNTSGYHCHFEVRVNGSTVNPLNYL